jgi:hypothetical protein
MVKNHVITIPYISDPALKDFIVKLVADNRKLNKKILKRDGVIMDLSTRLRTIETFLDGMSRYKKGRFVKDPIENLDLQVQELNEN